MIQSKFPHIGTTIFTVMSALANKHNAINLSQGFPNFNCDAALTDLVNHYMKEGYNQYAPMGGLPVLTHELAKKVDYLYANKIDPSNEITVTAGATQALFTAIGAIVHPGDEVILIDPAYDSYGPSIEAFGGHVVSYELRKPDYKINWDMFAKLISRKTKAIMINTPHNPTGAVLSKEDMEALSSLVKGTEIIIISDEVYEHIIFDELEHESVLKYPELYKRSFVIFSFGKTFHVTGWKLGYCIAPPFLMKEFRKVHQFNVFTVNTPMQYALADYLKEKEHYEQLPDFFEAKRNFFNRAVASSKLKPLATSGTYFQLFDYSGISDDSDTDFAKYITETFGVAAIPISVFYQSGLDEKVIRFCFAKTEDMLKDGAERICQIT